MSLEPASTTLSIYVYPSLSASLDASPKAGNIPLEVTFTITIENGKPPYEWTLDFGDGSTPISASRPEPGTFQQKHTYEKVGTFTATLTVQDALGSTVVKRLATYPGLPFPPQMQVVPLLSPLLFGSLLLYSASRQG